MKKIYLSILISTFILTSCDSTSQNTDIILKGKIGKFDAQMDLKKDGDFFNGLFTYETTNNKKIKLKGQLEGDKLRLSEFNNDNEITGLFIGDYINNDYRGEWNDVNGKNKVSFFFSKSKPSVKSNEKQGVAELKSKELLETYFKPYEYVTDSLGRYKIDNALFDIEFYKIENYKLDGKLYSIAIFGHHPLYKYENYYERGVGTSSNGNAKFSILKFVKNSNKWILLNQFDNLDIGHSTDGEVELAKIRQIENFTFLELKDVEFYGQGIHRYTEIFNTTNFESTFKTTSWNYKENIEEYIRSQNKNYYKDYVLSASDGASNNQDYNFIIRDNKLHLINEEKNAEYDENSKIWKNKENNIIYIFNEETLIFELNE